MSLRLSSWWTWILLLPLLASGCKGCHLGKAPAPFEFVCKSIAYYEVLDPEQGAGAAPFSIEQFGPKLEVEQMKLRPDLLVFLSETRVSVDWANFSKYRASEAIYSPEEGLARSTRPAAVVPTKRFSDGKLERVRFGFRSKVCFEPDERGSYYDCTPAENELFLVADMTCERILRYDAPRKERRRKLPTED